MNINKKIVSGVLALAVGTGLVLPQSSLNGVAQEVYASETSLDKPLHFQSSMNYGGDKDDSYKGIAMTKDGGFVTVGYSLGTSENPKWSHNSQGNSMSDDAIIVKYDKDHKVQWAKNFGDTGNDMFFDVAVTNNGTIVAIGKSQAKGYIVTIDPNNPDKFTENVASGTGGGSFESVVATKDGGYAVAGWSASKNNADWGKKRTKANRDAIVVKYDSNNKVVFANCYNYGADTKLPAPKKADFYGIAEDKNGDLVAVGDVQIAMGIYNSQIYKINGKSGEKIWYKAAGSKIKTKPADKVDYHTSSYERVDVLKDGSYIVVLERLKMMRQQKKIGKLEAR